MSKPIENPACIASSPFKAEGRKVFKLESTVPCRHASISFLPFSVCEVPATVLDPEDTARLIADALNAHKILETAETPAGKTALDLWLRQYVKHASPAQSDPLSALAAYRDTQIQGAQIVARFGLISLIWAVCRHLSKTLPNTSKT